MSDYATYSPDDNKLRLYPSSRLDAATYARVKAAGFKWAPKQGLFVAPMWTPDREDLLIDLCGEIEDEDKTLAERQEERAERFDGYHDNRTRDAERAHKAVSAIADNIPLGQPILIGHHSERHARRDAKRIENGMRRAVQMWETAQYWKDRAAGALRHAKYKELPAVRARRIKGLEADQRKTQKTKANAEAVLALWSREGLTQEQALAIAAAHWLTLPRKEGDRPDFSGNPTAYDALQNGHPTLYAPRTLAEIIDHAKRIYPRSIANCDRWLAHYAHRLDYERAMLAESGGLATDKLSPEKGGACQCWASPGGRGAGWSYIQKVNKISVTVLDNWGNGGANFTRTIPFDKLGKILSAAQVQEIRAAGRLQESADKCGFYWMQSREEFDKTNPPEEEEAPTPPASTPAPDPLAADMQAMKQSLKAGVRTVSAPQLFPTPPGIAARMIELAEIEPHHRVLEPSAGTGNLLAEMQDDNDQQPDHAAQIVAVEYNRTLAEGLIRRFPDVNVFCMDFLACNGNLEHFDRIVMNPPFSNGADIQHILHARHFLKPGGKIVALCANGPRQQAQLQPIADTWEPLPAGSFAEQGTGVSVALLTIRAAH